MVTLTLLCAAILLTAAALWLEHDERLRMMSVVRLLESQGDHDDQSQRRLTRADVAALLQAQGQWPLAERHVASCFVRTFRGHEKARAMGLPFVHYRRRQYTVRHVLGTCSASCNRCGHTRLWTAMARRAGLFDRWIAMAEAANGVTA